MGRERRGALRRHRGRLAGGDPRAVLGGRPDEHHALGLRDETGDRQRLTGRVSTPVSPRADRLHDFDALRVLAVVVLLAYHSSRPFDHEAWHLKSVELSRGLELLGYVFTPWRLSLLFLISGAGTY